MTNNPLRYSLCGETEGGELVRSHTAQRKEAASQDSADINVRETHVHLYIHIHTHLHTQPCRLLKLICCQSTRTFHCNPCTIMDVRFPPLTTYEFLGCRDDTKVEVMQLFFPRCRSSCYIMFSCSYLTLKETRFTVFWMYLTTAALCTVVNI